LTIQRPEVWPFFATPFVAPLFFDLVVFFLIIFRRISSFQSCCYYQKAPPRKQRSVDAQALPDRRV
jgi:hypothetical protein